MISEMVMKNDKSLMTPIVQTSEEICLVVADFRCQRCKSPETLQFHHLIMRTTAEYINDKMRYLSQRHYWGNIIILCKSCHDKYHNHRETENGEKYVISQKKIDKIKKRYEVKDVDKNRSEM